jgi:hypothetical protein
LHLNFTFMQVCWTQFIKFSLICSQIRKEHSYTTTII